MKALVIYDSQFGNTEQIARAIAEAIGAPGETGLRRASEVTSASLSGYDLLVVGSPTQRFHATELVSDLLTGADLTNVRAAAFDTRLDMAKVDSRALRLAVKVAGEGAYAAPRIAAQLTDAGATVVVPPEGFFVEDTEGPLAPGELARAGDWARRLTAAR